MITLGFCQPGLRELDQIQICVLSIKKLELETSVINQVTNIYFDLVTNIYKLDAKIQM